jgi:hypothetical protein
MPFIMLRSSEVERCASRHETTSEKLSFQALWKSIFQRRPAVANGGLFLCPTGSSFRARDRRAILFDVMDRPSRQKGWIAMLSALVGVLIIVVIGAICFWAIDKFAKDRRLAQLLKLLVVLICIAAILQRILPLLGIYI